MTFTSTRFDTSPDDSRETFEKSAPTIAGSFERATLPSGKVVKVCGLADPTRPWELHHLGAVAAIRRPRRGSAGDYQSYKGGCTSPLVLKLADAEALVTLLNTRVRKRATPAAKPRVMSTRPERGASNEGSSSRAHPDGPWKADSFGQHWYVCRDGAGPLGLAFYTDAGKPQKFDEAAARQMADRLNRAGERVS